MAKLMIIEDDIPLAEVYKTRLEAEGYRVSMVTDGEKAVAAAIKTRPDIILLDLMLPRIDGFNVLDILRNTDETKLAKVIVLSALSRDKDIAKAKGLGADEYLVKSEVTMNEVVESLKKAVPPETAVVS